MSDIDNILLKALKRVGQIIQDDAVSNCPVDTGQLRDSITYEIEITKDEGVLRVGTNLKYAPFVEFGTGIVGSENPNPDARGIRYRQVKWLGFIPDVGWRYISGQKAQPYLYPALINNREKIKEIIHIEIKEMFSHGKY